MEYELYHHGILGQKWGQRNGPPYPLSGSDHSAAEKRAARYRSGAERAEEKIAKNKAKIEKLNSYRNSKRNQKLEIKRNKLQIKRDRLANRVNSARLKRELYDVGPNRSERRAMKKAYKLDTKIARVERKQNIWQQKVNKLEYKNTKLEHKVQKYLAKADKLDAKQVAAGKDKLEKMLAKYKAQGEANEKKWRKMAESHLREQQRQDRKAAAKGKPIKRRTMADYQKEMKQRRDAAIRNNSSLSEEEKKKLLKASYERYRDKVSRE